VNQVNDELYLHWEHAMSRSEEPVWGEDEKALVEACGKKNRNAQQYVYKKYAAKMYHTCLRYAGDSDLAQDILHDGFIKIFDNIKKFRGDSKLETWITRIIINQSITTIKREARRAIKRDSSELQIPVSAEEVEPFSPPSNQESKAAHVLQKITELPLGYRTVLSMYALDNYSHKEISQILGISEGTSKSQLAKARKMLIKILGDEKK
jgi:RNA polymerase sigma factor (sigma-70 family)